MYILKSTLYLFKSLNADLDFVCDVYVFVLIKCDYVQDVSHVCDHWAPNNLLKRGAKEKHQLDPGGPSNRQEAPAPTN